MGAAAPVSARTTLIFTNARSATKHLVPEAAAIATRYSWKGYSQLTAGSEQLEEGQLSFNETG
jgi:hypothetical protein